MSSVTKLELTLLPTLFSPRGLLGSLVLVQIWCFTVSFASIHSQPVWVALGLVTLFSQFVLLSSLLPLYFFRKQLSHLRVSIQATCIGLSVVLHSIVMSVLVAKLDILSLEITDLSTFVFKNAFVSILLVSFFLFVLAIYTDNMRKIQSLSQARFQSLQARMHPHFLFNSLNAAAELTHVDPNAAEKMLIDLAKLARSSLLEQSASTLHEEVALAKAYLDIEKWRLGNRLEVHWQLDNALLDLKVPSLTLQPLLENAVKHGIQPLEQGGCIDVFVRAIGVGFEIEISNPKSMKGSSLFGSGIALENLKSRLALFYNHHASLQVDSSTERFRVTIVVKQRIR
ncbi:probable two-component system sensor protein [Pseudoalteromonas luteoviolacea B = ATCC 29581]|nr:probable two-component system sensor protein [Pseudoalteromonas luteoviolacea B = ATCC 29581]